MSDLPPPLPANQTEKNSKNNTPKSSSKSSNHSSNESLPPPIPSQKDRSKSHKRRSRFDCAPPNKKLPAKNSNDPIDPTEKMLRKAQKITQVTGSATKGFEVKLNIPDQLAADKNINFVSLVIGPEGQTQRMLQRDLQCRINIMSQSGEKVSKDTIKGLYFIISAATKNRLDVAVAYLNHLMEDQDARNALKIAQEQVALEEKYKIGNENEDVLMIPAEKVGILLEKNGETIQEAMKQTGAVIRVERDVNPKHPNTREVQILGEPAQIRKAREIIENSLGDRTIRANGQIEYDDFLNIPQNLMGIVIGRAGETIKNIQRDTGCVVQVVAQGDPNDLRAPKIIRLRGTTEEISLAKEHILSLTGKYKTNPESRNRPLGNEVEIIAIPISCVGTLLGRGGESVKRLAFLTGTRVQVLPAQEQNEAGFDSSRFKKVSIRGDADCIDRAKEEIQKLIDVMAHSANRTEVVNPYSATTPEEARELMQRYMQQQAFQLPEWAAGSDNLGLNVGHYSGNAGQNRGGYQQQNYGHYGNPQGGYQRNQGYNQGHYGR